MKKKKIKDIDINSRRDAETVYNLMRELIQSGGWQFMTRILEENKKVFERYILTGKDDNGKKFEDHEMDEMRAKWDMLDQFLRKPEEIMRECRPSEVGENTDDPYFRNVKEVGK